MSPDELERAIIERLRPLRPQLVMLFGSRAQGRADPGSDYDLLVVMDPKNPDDFRTPSVRLALGNLPAAFDILVYTPEEWAAWKHHPQSFASHIQKTGRVLHAA